MARWFHKNINGTEAEALLMEKGKHGSFLVRNRQNNDGFAIDVRWNEKVIHIKVQQQGECFTLGYEPFATLSDLVEHYQHNEIKDNEGNVIFLLYPLYQDDIITERWFHEGISGPEAEWLLLEKGRDGSFLVRVSQRTVDSYVVSARVGTRVSHVLIMRNPVTNFYNVGGGKDFATVSELIQFYMKSPMVETSGSIITLVQPINTTRISIPSLSDRILLLQKVNNRSRSGFSQEFEELQSESHEGAKSRRQIGELDINRNKNRYRNILPFDDTRVILREGLARSGSHTANADTINDYINANYIVANYKQLPNVEPQIYCDRKYIATQGPLTNTIVDFWRMVWQEESTVIVMITNFVENKKAKCEPYWPANLKEPEIHPLPDGTKLKVELLSENSNADYTLREFLLSKESLGMASLPRRIYHFHFTSWPDRWTPEDPSRLLNFLDQVNDKQKENGADAPMIVHCSAGIGRTGTYIAIDMLVQHILNLGLQCEIDISRTIQLMRDQRSGMVQTEQQYRFVYKSILGEVETIKQRSQMEQVVSRTGHDYTNIYGVPNDPRRIGSGTSPPRQYASLRDVSPVPNNSPPSRNPVLPSTHMSSALHTNTIPVSQKIPVGGAPERPPRRTAQRSS